jgi:putative CRISPR-associated protein (TIGR02619 family)
MTRYLCTVGTSASQQVMAQPEIMTRLGAERPGRLDAAAVEKLGGIDAAVAAMEPHFLALDYRDETTLRRKLSAEVHSLVRLDPGPDDEVQLLATDTPDGVVCARLVAAYLRQRLGLRAVHVHRIEGLQVDDGERFRRVGIVNYIQKVRQFGDASGWGNVVLNPTGGFKALIPYTTLLGMLFGARVCYIFDNGRELLTLPPLPLEFNLPLLGRLEPQLKRLEAECEIPEAEFWGSIPYEQREPLRPLLEPSDRAGWVTLSGLGVIALERLQRGRDGSCVPILLSVRAWEDYFHNPPEKDLDARLAMLSRSSRSQLQSCIEKKHDGSSWYKPGRTQDRWRVEWEGEALLVYRILGHDEYERQLGHAKWDRKDFTPFLPYTGGERG